MKVYVAGLALALATVMVVGCGDNGGGTIVQDTADTGAPGETRQPEICATQCEGKECGPDGCGGLCGECIPLLETCSDAGLCESFPCATSLDCPSSLVCDKDAGICVVCVGDEDCEEGLVCGADHQCHSTHDCDSDKDCKDFGLVCDKDAGLCVQCLTATECGAEEYCLDGYCVADVCVAGDSRCDGQDVLTCNAEGSAEELTATCADEEYCEAGACHAQVCEPGAVFCDGDLLQTCDELGKAVVDTVDCAAEGQVCHDGACSDLVCEPGTTWCVDDLTAAACAADGMSSTLSPCAAEHYCDDGICLAWVCEPGAIFCDGEVYKVCNANGSAVQYEEDCEAAGKHCFGGACIDTVCAPGQDFCLDGTTLAHCAADGMSSTPEPCPAQHYCGGEEGAAECLAWVCEPGASYCEANVAKVCNSQGSAVVNEVPCGDQTCVSGECKSQLCAPDTTYCDGPVVMQCDGTGTGATEVATCGPGQYCGEDGNSAACQDQVCTPGELSCEGPVVVQCDSLGAGTEPQEDCAQQNQGCADGACVDQYCGDGVVQDGEECDDGNENLWDGCTFGCVSEGTGAQVFAGGAKTIIEDPGLSSTFAVSFWFKPDSLSGPQGLLIKKDTPGPLGSPALVPVKIGLESTELYASVGVSEELLSLGSTPVGLGWTHVAVLVTPDLGQLYVDGELVGQADLLGIDLVNTHDFSVGVFPHSSFWGSYFKGTIYGLQMADGVEVLGEFEPCLQAVSPNALLIDGEGPWPDC